MPSEHSIHRLALLAKRVQADLRRGGMAINFRLMFRSTATLTRVVALLAEQVAHLTAEVEALRARANPPAARAAGGSRVRSGAAADRE
jgi:hypothetical protein